MTKPLATRYRATNWSSYNHALRKRGSLLIWLDKEMTWHAPHECRFAPPPVFSIAAIQFCLSVKVLFKLPLRQTAGMVASLLSLAGPDWPVPDQSTLCRRQKTLTVQIAYRRADGPLHLLVDICQWTPRFTRYGDIQCYEVSHNGSGRGGRADRKSQSGPFAAAGWLAVF